MTEYIFRSICLIENMSSKTVHMKKEDIKIRNENEEDWSKLKKEEYFNIHFIRKRNLKNYDSKKDFSFLGSNLNFILWTPKFCVDDQKSFHSQRNIMFHPRWMRITIISSRNLLSIHYTHDNIFRTYENSFIYSTRKYVIWSSCNNMSLKNNPDSS